VSTRRVTEVSCDGCGKTATASHAHASRPSDWRRLHVTGAENRQWVFDICGPHCASKVIDGTYAREDRDELAARRAVHPSGGPSLHSLPVQ
jgi:hypothetical protein